MGKPDPIFVDDAFRFNWRLKDHAIKRRERILPFPWYGGKFSHLKWLLPLLPKCYHYVEPFAGSGAVLLNRDPSPLETYNDMNGDVVNFYRVLRDRPRDLIRALRLTPYSREDYVRAIYDEESTDPVEKARRFFVVATSTFTANVSGATIGQWSRSNKNSNCGMAASVSRFTGHVEDLSRIAERLICVQIENRPAIDVITRYDTPDTFFYCDPPYVKSTRVDKDVYAFEMEEDEHRRLADVLNHISGRAAVSGYDCPLYDEIFPADRWKKYYAEPKSGGAVRSGDKRQEVLWMNYNTQPIEERQILLPM